MRWMRCAKPRGEHEEALALLARSVTHAAGAGALRILLDLGAGLRPLLQELLSRAVAPAFIGRLLAPCPPAPAVVAPVPPNRPADMLLTNREMDVLLLLAQRLTDKEIAQILIISPRTVKKHTYSICQKLEASNRRAAVSQARAIGILPVP